MFCSVYSVSLCRSVYCLCVNVYCTTPPGVKPIAINKYEPYSDSKYHFVLKTSSKVSYKILLLSDSTFFKLFFHIFAAILRYLS